MIALVRVNGICGRTAYSVPWTMRPGRHHDMWEMQPEVRHREWRRDPEHLTDCYASEHGDQCDRRALIPHQTEDQRGDRNTEPDLRTNQPDAERREGEAETKLQARRDAARQSAREAAHHAGQSENQEERTDHETGPSNRRWSHRLDQHRCRCCLHRLHSHRHAVESSCERIKQPKCRQDAGRVHLHDRDGPDDMRQECPEIAERAGYFAHVPGKTRTSRRGLAVRFSDRDIDPAQQTARRTSSASGFCLGAHISEPHEPSARLIHHTRSATRYGILYISGAASQRTLSCKQSRLHAWPCKVPVTILAKWTNAVPPKGARSTNSPGTGINGVCFAWFSP